MAFCPFCFNEINLKTLNMRCSSISCLEPGKTEVHIIDRKKARVDRRGFGTCDICGRTTHKLVCDSCGHDLPDTIRESETKIISIIGAKGSGKSYFVAALLRQIMEDGLLSYINDSSTMFISDGREIYNKRYKKNMDDGVPLDGTRLVTNIVRDNPPVLAQITSAKPRGFGKGKSLVSYTYSFFDAAGESFSDPAVLASITPYIAHSEAIIFILDPRQIPEVNKAVSAVMPKLPPVSNDTYENTVNSVADVIRNNKRLDSQKAIKVPVCVAFSKWDLLINTPNLLPADFMINNPNTFSFRGFNPDIIRNSGEEIRSLLRQWAPGFLTTVEQQFEDVMYFGFSAWGMGSKDGRNIPAIAPFRVEDPFLWILNRNGLL